MKWIIWGQRTERDHRGERIAVSYIIGTIEGPANRFRARRVAVKRFGAFAVDHLQLELSYEVDARERASLHPVRRFVRCRPP